MIIKMRVLSQAEIDAMLSRILENPTILPGTNNNGEKSDLEKKAQNESNSE